MIMVAQPGAREEVGGVTDRYILGPGHIIVPAGDLMLWAMWFGNIDNRRVAETHFAIGSWVSTVFLGLDHNFWGEGPPILFETMVFADDGCSDDLGQERYATWDEAVAGHERAVEKLMAWIEKAGKVAAALATGDRDVS